MDVWQNKEEKETSLDLLESPPLRQRRQHQQEEEEEEAEEACLPTSKTVTVDLNLVTGHQTNHYYSEDEEEEVDEEEDYGDTTMELPISNFDASVKKSQVEAQKLMNLQKANKMNASSSSSSNRPLRKRNRFAASWKPWQKWILTILVSIPGHEYMPKWFSRLLTPKGFGKTYNGNSSNLWNGVRRQDLIKKTKHWLKTIGSVLIGCLLLWFLLPMIFSSFMLLSSTSSAGRHAKLQAGIVKNLYVRIDDAGVSMTNPLSLTDLLYDRSSKTTKFIQNLQVIMNEISNKMLQQGFGPIAAANDREESTVFMEPIKENLIKKAFSAYYQNELWLHFMESQMISKPKDMQKHLQWIQHHCGSSKTSLINSKVADEKAFPEIAKTYGYLEIDVTELTDESFLLANGRFGLSQELKQQQTEKNNRLNKALQNLGQGDPVSMETIPFMKESMQLPLLPSPESLRSYKNVSLNDVNILMRFLAVETRKAWLNIMKESFCDSISFTKIAFDVSVISSSFWSSSASFCSRFNSATQTHYTPKTAMEKAATDILWSMDPSKQAEMRGDGLWTGMTTGCICAHHVGLPLPGVAWIDPNTNKPHTLFYPNLDKIKESTSSSTKKGFLFSSLQGFFGEAEPEKDIKTSSLNNDKYPVHQPKNHPLEYTYVDPVLINSKRFSSHQYLGQMYWIEGYDYKGFKRRVRVKSPELACISACLVGCGA